MNDREYNEHISHFKIHNIWITLLCIIVIAFNNRIHYYLKIIAMAMATPTFYANRRCMYADAGKMHNIRFIDGFGLISMQKQRKKK